MDGRNTKGEVFVSLTRDVETCFSDHVCKGFLVWELSDTFDKVLVRVSIVGNQLSHQWQEGERVCLIEVVESRIIDLGEF